tara:strand:+ start:286 stop:465 length:180 start_codon:yes stop_codon:yes gene_type:complete
MEISKKNYNKIISYRKKTKCPNCKKISKIPFIPFCSQKCANLDLMKWLNDEHEINLKSD